jgi:ribosomal protein L37E
MGDYDYCRNCGKTIRIDADICVCCGYPPSLLYTEYEARNFCDKCGKSVGKNDKTCSNCGHSLTTEPPGK